MTASQFTIFGNKYRMGSYILLIRVSGTLQLAFGRFQGGKLLRIDAGEYLYIGSALGAGRSGSPLARRLIRHTTRCSGEPHQIRAALLELFRKEDGEGVPAIEPSKKKLRWHIDYLLERREAEISHIMLVRSPERLEQKLSDLVASLEESSVLAPRLGAQDTRRSTHLLRISDREKVIGLLRQAIAAMTEL